MERFLYNFVSVELLFFAILWSIYTIFVSWGTSCFDMFYAYITIVAFIVQLVWDHFVKPEMVN